MKYFPFIDLFSWFMGGVYTVLLWIVTIDVISVSIIFSFLLGLISLGITVIYFVLTRRLFYLLRGFIIMNKIRTKKPQPQPNPELINNKKPKKPKFRDIDNNR
jgi:general stress protein CsbA